MILLEEGVTLRPNPKAFIIAALLFFTVLSGAYGQRFEIGVLGAKTRINDAPLGSLDDDPLDDDTSLEGEYGYGARFTFNTRGYYGHEIGYINSRAVFRTRLEAEDGATRITHEDRIRIQQAFYNFMIYFMPAGERWRPFITGGLQIHQYGDPNIPDIEVGKSRNYGANYGGGIKLRLFRNALARFDVRDYIGGKPYDLTFEDPTRSGGVVRHLELSFGLSLTF